MAKSRLLFVVNIGWFFVSHRLPLAIAAKQEGYDVQVATALDAVLDVNTPSLMASHGLVLSTLRFSRRGAGLFELLRDFADLIRLFRRLQPEIVHLVALKPVLLGGIAARFCGDCRVVMAIPGRGSVFSARGPLAVVRRALTLIAYRMAYRPGKTRVIFQNVEDRDYFSGKSIFRTEDVVLIRGSGVSPADFPVLPEPVGIPVIALVSRMLREKGVQEFVDAAKVLKSAGVVARFVLVGEPDPGSPKSHTQAELETWAIQGDIEWWGYRKDIAAVFAGCNVVCLPTYYGEGLPKVLIEAAASGRCIVTTDIPGCRDIVRHGVNGLLVQPRQADQLADALRNVIANGDLRRKMGLAGRQLVEREFSLQKVTTQTLSLYGELSNAAR